MILCRTGWLRPKDLTFILLVFGVCAWSAPQIFVEEKIHDCGVVCREERGTVVHTFLIQNVGDETLKIEQVKPSCGCTRADLSLAEIPPGEFAELEAELDLRSKSGKTSIRISVFSNDPENKRVELGLACEVIQRWTIYPTRIEGGVLVRDTTTTRMIRLTSQCRKGEALPHIVGAHANNPAVRVALQEGKGEIDRDAFIETSAEAAVVIEAASSIENNGQASVDFQTDDPGRPWISIPVHWIVEGDLSLSLRSLQLVRSRYQLDDELTPEQKFRDRRALARDTQILVVSSRSGTDFRILDVSAAEPFEVYWVPGLSGPRSEILVSLKKGDPGHYDRTVTITTDRPAEQILTVAVSGEIQQQAPFLTCSSTVHHFGSFFSDEIREVSKTFVLRNSGSLDLNMNLHGSRKGNVALGSRKLVPGATTTLVLTAPLEGRTGLVEEEALLRTNDPMSPSKTFLLRGNILPRWELVPPTVQFHSVIPGQAEMRNVLLRQFFTSWEEPVGIVNLKMESPRLAVEVGKTQTVHGNIGYSTAETELTIQLIPGEAPGEKRSEITLQVSAGTKFPPPPIPLEWNVLGDLGVRPKKVVLAVSEGSAASGPPTRQVRVYSRSKRPFTIRVAKAPEGVEVVEIENGRDGAQFDVKVVDGKALLAATPNGNRRIVFSTDREGQESVEVEIEVRSQTGI